MIKACNLKIVIEVIQFPKRKRDKKSIIKIKIGKKIATNKENNNLLVLIDKISIGLINKIVKRKRKTKTNIKIRKIKVNLEREVGIRRKIEIGTDRDQSPNLMIKIRSIKETNKQIPMKKHTMNLKKPEVQRES